MINGHYHKSVASIDSKEGCPIIPGATLSKVFYLLPSSETNKSKRGIALDGMLKEGDTNLASSTLNTADALGIVISYMVRVRLYMGAIGESWLLTYLSSSPVPPRETEGSHQHAEESSKATFQRNECRSGVRRFRQTTSVQRG
ncbi:arrestin, lateral eye [Caerostris extrusa]|uniref:Arrestin, lateral eye n=1 Tax=Caerostris extrusa TaxID=172846 RepID=A0AAV4W3X1_CAEEX|nr:arrestin, lateral eye [Caerostris extrusa]